MIPYVGTTESLMSPLELIERCAEIAEARAAQTADGDGEIYIACRIAADIRALKVSMSETHPNDDPPMPAQRR